MLRKLFKYSKYTLPIFALLKVASCAEWFNSDERYIPNVGIEQIIEKPKTGLEYKIEIK